ncbi:MAG: C4-dicarboxylate ABC transporter, partial [Pseudomonadota bacterium]
EIALGESTMHTYVESDHSQFAAMAEYQAKHGVKVKRWSDEDLAAFEKAWLEVLAEESAKDPLFKKVADHYLGYRKKFAVWGDSQTMKPTYLSK